MPPRARDGRHVLHAIPTTLVAAHRPLLLPWRAKQTKDSEELVDLRIAGEERPPARQLGEDAAC